MKFPVSRFLKVTACQFAQFGGKLRFLIRTKTKDTSKSTGFHFVVIVYSTLYFLGSCSTNVELIWTRVKWVIFIKIWELFFSSPDILNWDYFVTVCISPSHSQLIFLFTLIKSLLWFSKICVMTSFHVDRPEVHVTS